MFNTKVLGVLSLVSLSFFSVPAHAQCRDKQDQFCRNLQYILYSAQTDFGPFQGPQQFYDFGLFRKSRASHPAKLPNPDVSFAGAKVPCQVSNWMNGVAVYMCEGQVSAADTEQWYAKTLAELQQLQYLWQFKTQTSGTDHSVDAGPADCEVAPQEGGYITEGPYFGHCPLHIQTVRQADGTDDVHLWVSSYSSPFLAHRLAITYKSQWAKSQTPSSSSASATSQKASASPATTQNGSASAATAQGPSAEGASSSAPLRQTKEEAAVIRAGCDELCAGLKKILEGRWTGFKDVSAPVTGNGASQASSGDAPIKLVGAASCSLSPAGASATRTSASNEPTPRVRLAAATTPASKNNKAAPGPPAATAAQYVCYWPEQSATAAETRFRGLVSLMQVLIPSTWSAHEQNEADELSGLKVTVWSVRDAADKKAIGLYLSGQSVGLHVTAAD